jgi:hypothetical protein
VSRAAGRPRIAFVGGRAIAFVFERIVSALHSRSMRPPLAMLRA